CAGERLVTASPEDRGAEDLPRLGIDDDLHEALCLAFLDRAPDAAHRPLRAEQGAAAGARLAVGHADTAERRIDVQGVANNAVADLARLAVEQIGGDDLEVVVGGMGEGAAAVALAERPDAWHVGR